MHHLTFDIYNLEYIYNYIYIYDCICNTISFERGPRSERRPGSARARQNGFNFETFLARARGPRTPFTPRTSFKGNFVML